MKALIALALLATVACTPHQRTFNFALHDTAEILATCNYAEGGKQMPDWCYDIPSLK